MVEAAVRIPGYAHGYPEVAFGGYVAGVLAANSEDPTELRVDFRAPVPVETPLTITATESGGRALSNADGLLLAQTAKATVTIAAPPAPSWAEAQAATAAALSSPERSRGDCFGCGADCEPGRGMRLFTSKLPGHDLIAGAWSPDPALGGAGGELSAEHVWSLLDCPGGWAAMTMRGMRPGAVTAALTGTQLRPVSVGAEYISYAWAAHRAGRKYTVGVALATADGSLCALAEALWIEPRPS
ncbi:PaaI family thioesterase [Nocardia goodfellowii]|uniref:Acyl-coenzyme A thioesterase PaaI-like protein n=1 Tax=Nocardia goodfellowii TaxID=882446 RepID=A0ABS4QL30_9NOCA|nr:hypothetical protein [Nocardia goodfellowii]MBP2192409.1 acyl-coenzyme A thioesterase PaaI-like protein [Nocardia goodfellowii]